MKELIEVLAQSLVDHPEEVTVTQTEKDIGKQGRIAKAIRSVVKAAASRTDKKVTVEIGQ